jgi:hypothetical protein
MHPYDYPKQEWQFNLCPEKSSPHWLWHQAAFHSAYQNRYQENDTARGEYFVPRREERSPLVIMLPAADEEK